MDLLKIVKIDWQPFKRLLVSADTEDIVAIGATILCVGGVLAAIIVSTGLAFGKIEATSAEHIILGCVGGSAVSGVTGAIVGKKAKGKRTKKKAA
jgi:hypothetical protein